MSTSIICLGDINLDLRYEVEDLEGFLREWNTGLKRGGEEAVSPPEEARLTALLARYGRPLDRLGGGLERPCRHFLHGFAIRLRAAFR